MINSSMHLTEIEEFCTIISQKQGDIELDYTNTYTLLIAVVLSARMTDKGVNKATKALFKIISTPEEMLALTEEGLKKHIKTIGLYKTKAKHIMQLSQILMDKFSSQVPQDLISLESLPGVGRKTANVMLNHAFKQIAFPVDTHVFRVCNRTGLASGKTPLSVEHILQKIIPEQYQANIAHCMVLHGRYICKSINPKCSQCPVNHLCEFYKTNNALSIK